MGLRRGTFGVSLLHVVEVLVYLVYLVSSA